ncbi:hypothetical protein [Vibrio caribbeanicus]|uniref:hypothetical protein n=1 Tax=Vibrio caribbeanicus TaxID=701175 RepID=UPI0030DD2001
MKIIKKFSIILCVLIAQNAWSANVTVTKITDKESLVPSKLNNTIDRIISAYSGANRKYYAQPENQWAKKEVRVGLDSLQKRSIARFEYKYGSTKRIYHSFSGETLLNKPLVNNGGAAKEQFKTWSQEEMRENEVLVGNKISEADYENVERYFKASSFKQANDAEIKALRQIETDISEGIIPAGGKLTVYVNQIPCESCMPLFEEQLKEWPEIASAEVSYLPQNKSYFSKTTSHEMLYQDNDAYRYSYDRGAIAETTDEETLQGAFTTHRLNKTKYGNFLEEYNNTEQIAAQEEATACAI